MSDQSKIENLEKRIQVLENENSLLKSMLKQQATFGNKMTAIVAKMDELLVKKKTEIETLTNQLLARPPPLATAKTENVDFSIDLETSTSEIGFLEVQKYRRMLKKSREKEFERTNDGKFKCPFKGKTQTLFPEIGNFLNFENLIKSESV